MFSSSTLKSQSHVSRPMYCLPSTFGSAANSNKHATCSSTLVQVGEARARTCSERVPMATSWNAFTFPTRTFCLSSSRRITAGLPSSSFCLAVSTLALGYQTLFLSDPGDINNLILFIIFIQLSQHVGVARRTVLPLFSNLARQCAHWH